MSEISVDRRALASALLAAGALAALAGPLRAAPPRRLVQVFLRGGADGLALLAPYGEPAYSHLRARIAAPPPGTGPESLIALDGLFGLHPALAPLKPLYDAGQVAWVHACGRADGSRSHFINQDLIETAAGGPTPAVDGWLARYLNATDDSPFAGRLRALALGLSVPASLRGYDNALAIADLTRFGLTESRFFPVRQTLAALNAGADPAAADVRAAFADLTLFEAADPDTQPIEGGAIYPAGAFGEGLRAGAQLIKSGLGGDVLTLDLGGWDHHSGLPEAMAPLASQLASGIAAFFADLGPGLAQEVTLVAMSEFGRRAADNASRGTDHGRGGLVLLAGGGVNGGRVFGDWPGLAPSDLDAGDLRVTTDIRQVYYEILTQRLGVFSPGTVLPGFTPRPTLGLLSD